MVTIRLLAFSSAYTQQLRSSLLYLHEVHMYLLQHSVTSCKWLYDKEQIIWYISSLGHVKHHMHLATHNIQELRLQLHKMFTVYYHHREVKVYEVRSVISLKMVVNAYPPASVRSGLRDHNIQDLVYIYLQFWPNPALLGQTQLSARWHWVCAELAELRASYTRWQVGCTELVVWGFWPPAV